MELRDLTYVGSKDGDVEIEGHKRDNLEKMTIQGVCDEDMKQIEALAHEVGILPLKAADHGTALVNYSRAMAWCESLVCIVSVYLTDLVCSRH